MGGITARSMLWAKRLLVVGALCLGLAFALNGCSQAPSQNAPESADGAAQTDQAAQNETRTFTDSAGRTVEVPAKIDRIAPAGHTATQVLLTMAPDKLVTISTELTADQAKYLGGDYANLPVTGAAFGAKGDLNKEAVAASGAQILIDTGEIKDGMKEDLDTMQQQLGIPVVVIETKMEDYGAAYEKLGELLGMEDRGKELSDYCKAAYDETVSVMSKIPEGDRAKVAYLLGDKGTNTIAKNSYQGQVIDLVADNVADLGTVGSDAAFADLSAIKNGSYYKVPGTPWNWLNSPPTVNQVLGMQWLPRLLYPEQYDNDLYKTVAGYFKTFYGYDLSESEFNEIAANARPKA